MIDATLKQKLARLTQAGDRMHAINVSIAEKEGLVENLKSNEPKFEGLPAVLSLVKETVARLEAEIVEEKKLLEDIHAEISQKAQA